MKSSFFFMLVIVLGALLTFEVGAESYKVNAVNGMLSPSIKHQLSQNTNTAYKSGNDSCAKCEKAIAHWGAIAADQTEVDKLISELSFACKHVGLSDELQAICVDVVSGIVGYLPEFSDLIATLEWDSPEAICSVVGKCVVDCCDTPHNPEQLRLSLTDNDYVSEMAVTWTTLDGGDTGTVQYGKDKDELSSNVTGPMRTYKWAGWNGMIYSATMTGLPESTTIYYRVGSAELDVWSEVYSFNTFSEQVGTDDNNPLKIAVIGDMGWDFTSDDTIKQVTDLVNAGKVHMILHVGDISYADGWQRQWDVFLRKVEPIASKVPYMVSPGNHEFWFNFAAYKSRFFMPNFNETANMYYGFNVGTLHVSSTDTENFVDTAYMSTTQQSWLAEDLKDNRDNHYWVVAVGHRPYWCVGHGGDCGSGASYLRGRAEDLFYDHQVDLVLAGHVHNYQRTAQVYQNKTCGEGYNSNSCPTYIVQGASGNREGNHVPDIDSEDWMLAGSEEVSYGIMTVHKKTFNYTQYNSSNNAVLDDFMMSRT